METIIIRGDTQRAHARLCIDKAPENSVVTISEAKEARTKAQNRLIHRWFADVSRALVGQSPADVKADCNLTYGLPIMTRDDPEWSEVFGYIFDALNRPAKLKAIRVLDVPFTRRMKVKQLTEYMTHMRQDYEEVGILLTDPELKKYEDAT